MKKKIVSLLLVAGIVASIPSAQLHAVNELTDDPDYVGYAEEEFDYAELDGQYTWYLRMIDSGEMSEAFVFGRYIRKGAFSREVVARMVADGYFRQYLDEILRENYTWYRLLTRLGYQPEVEEESTATYTSDTYDIYSVKPCIGYTLYDTDIFLLPEMGTSCQITILKGYPVEITGTCTNGYYQIHMGDGYYYVRCDKISFLEQD